MSKIKFTIHGFQQDKLIKNGLDNNDALVMSVIKDFFSYPSMEFEIIDGQKYIWISQTYLSTYIPIIGSYRTFRRIFKKLCDNNVLESVTLNSRNGKSGKYFYVKPTQLFENLSEYVEIDQSKPIMGQNVLRSKDKVSVDHGTNCPIKDTPITDTHIIDSKHYGISDSETQQIEEIWNSIIGTPNIRPLKKGSSRMKALNARFKDYGFDGLLEMLCKVRDSHFLTGNNPKNWTANFDWVLNPNNFLKIIEDTYINKEASHERSSANNQKQSKLSTFQERAIALSESVDQNRHILDELPDDHRF